MSQTQELPAESWANKPKPQSQPLDQETINKIEVWEKEVNAEKKGKSRFFKLDDGEQVEVFFDMRDPAVGRKMTPVFGKDENGERKQAMRMNFILWNERDQCNQLWTPADQWASRIFAAIKDWGEGLLVRRTGTGKNTDYMFLPPGFKRAM